jgi:hypothetical protein
MSNKRVMAKMFISYDRNSDEYTEKLIQYLQEKKKVSLFRVTLFSYWSTIDKEEVPTFAWIQRNCLGFTDWKSKWFGLENIFWDTKNKHTEVANERI